MNDQIDLIPVVESDDADAVETCDCDNCGTSVPQDDTHSVRVNWRQSQTWCDECTSDSAVTCDSCDEPTCSDYTTRVRTSTRRTSTWCDSCASGETVTNSDSGEIGSDSYAQENWYFHDSDEEWHSEPEADDDELHDYGTDVIEEHGWPRITKRDSLCMGVELEMECRVSRGDVINALGGRDGDGRYILKEDGSLCALPGLELVTLPYTLDHHASAFDWSRLLRPLQRIAQSGSGTHKCGMHVHVNRRALTPLQIGKALVFLNCNSNSGFVTYVAQRSSNTYCGRDSSKKIVNGQDSYCDRHDILNINGSNTIEFRLFRGNLRPERVLKNIEFCHALLTYCATASVRDVEMFAPFCDWISKRSRTYPHLTRYLRDGSYLAARRPIPEKFAHVAAVAAVVDA